MQKVGKIILVLSVVSNLILGFILLNKSKDIETNPNIYINKIDSLELEISNIQKIRDSIRSSIDTVFINIKDNEKRYEKIRDTIRSNSVNDDYLFFTEYLKWNKNRFNSINNP